MEVDPGAGCNLGLLGNLRWYVGVGVSGKVGYGACPPGYVHFFADAPEMLKG